MIRRCTLTVLAAVSHAALLAAMPPQEGLRLRDQLELAIGGQYRVVGFGSNHDRHPASLTDRQSSVNRANLRMRTWLNLYDAPAKRAGSYLQVEIGGVALGEDREFPKGSGNDDVGLELRRGYLWYAPRKGALLRLGVLDWHDRFGERPEFRSPQWAVDAYDSTEAVLANSVWDFNVGGLDFELADSGPWRYRLSLLGLEDGDRSFTGNGGAVLLGGDLDHEEGTTLLGASVYYLADNAGYSYGDFGGPRAVHDSSRDLWAGLRGHFRFGDIRPSAFLIVNQGETRRPDWKHLGWAAKTAVDVVSDGTRYAARLLFSSGDDGSSATRSGEFRTIAQSERDNFGSQGYWSRLAITSPRGPYDTNDLGVGLQNRGLGLITIQGSVDTPLDEQLSLHAGIGWLRSAESNPRSGDSDIGVELVAELNVALTESSALDIGTAWLRTGSFFEDGSDPDDLYAVYLRFQLEF